MELSTEGRTDRQSHEQRVCENSFFRILKVEKEKDIICTLQFMNKVDAFMEVFDYQ